jgi:hypothetical protein
VEDKTIVFSLQLSVSAVKNITAKAQRRNARKQSKKALYLSLYKK